MHGARADRIQQFPFEFAAVNMTGDVVDDDGIKFDSLGQIARDDLNPFLKAAGFFRHFLQRSF